MEQMFRHRTYVSIEQAGVAGYDRCDGIARCAVGWLACRRCRLLDVVNEEAPMCTPFHIVLLFVLITIVAHA